VRPKKGKEANRSSFLVHAHANLLNIRKRSRGPSTSRTEQLSLAGSCVMKTVNETHPKAQENSYCPRATSQRQESPIAGAA